MKPSTVNAIKKLIAARAASLRWLTLSWFGGEPLLAEGVICEVSEHAHALSEAHGFGLSGGLTTNGYLLTPDKVRRLHGLKHRTYQITLDGYDETHNRTRRLANGGPTFDRIWKNLLAIRDMDLDVEIMLRIHVSPHNITSLPILLSEIDRELSRSRKFKIHFHRVTDLGGPGGSTVQSIGWEEYGRMVHEFSETLKLATTSEYQLTESGYICYAAKPNSLLIRADGRVGKCTVALDDPRNHVGNLRGDGTIEFFDERLRLWFEGFRNLDERMLGCPLPALKADPMKSRVERRIPASVV